MKFKFKNNNSGQSIIEVLIALSLVVIVTVGLIIVTTNSIKNSSFARDQRTATKYAQESLENARQLKEEDPNAFWLKSGTETETLGQFTREITYFLNAGDDTMQINVTVTWQDNQGEHQSSLETALTK